MKGLTSRLTAFLSALGLILTLGFTTVGPATASTPDGETPANEGVCDSLQSATPGLYGLCVAYCEAQDLDDIEKEPPNTKILENYRKKMKAGDPDMPCIQPECPCWSSEEIAAMTGDGVAASCVRSTGKIQLNDDGPFNFADADTNVGRERCRFIDTGVIPPTVRSQSISAEDAQACFTILEQECDALGL